MKKTTVILLILLLGVMGACSREYLAPTKLRYSDIYPKAGNNITLNNIKEYLGGYKNIKDTKGASVSVTPVMEGADTILYLINYQEGWELLSADRRAPRVFAMGEKGNTTIEELTSIPALEYLYQGFVERISYLKRNPEVPSSGDYNESWDEVLNPRSFWELISTTIIEEGDTVQNHLTQTCWGQVSPWNIRAPYGDSTMTYHCVTGCVPVAIAQMLYYLHQKEGVPTTAYQNCYTQQYVPTLTPPLILQPSDVAFYNPSSTNWNNMPLSETDTGSFEAVSALMVQIGVLLPTWYYKYQTATPVGYIADVFQQDFSISCIAQYSADVDIIANQVFSAQMPVILAASCSQNSHCFIVDACMEHYRIIKKVYRSIRPLPVEDPELNPHMYDYMTVYETNESARYFGVNWGWGGSGMDQTWLSADVISWPMGGYVYNTIDCMLYGFCQ